MIPQKKDVPVGLHPMWSGAAINLGICFFNLLLYSMNNGTISLIAAIISLGVAVNAFRIIRREARKELWRKLGGTYAG